MAYNGKFAHFDPKNPKPYAQCDGSGMLVMHEDLRWYKEYAGDGLINSGYLVHYRFLDKPNPQNLAPLVYLDPIPIENPRPSPYITEID